MVADVVLARHAAGRAPGAWPSGAGHSIGVTVAGLGLLVVVARVAGPDALHGVARSGAAALAGSALGAAAGLLGARALGADPVPSSGVLVAIARRRGRRGDRAGDRRGRHDGHGAGAPHRGGARAAHAGRPARRDDGRCTVTEASPLRGRRIVEVLATSAGGVGTPRAHDRPRHPRRRCLGWACAARRPRRSCSGSPRWAPTSRPVGISSGLAPVADSRAVAQLRRATAGADLVHAHGLRAGLVAADRPAAGGGAAAARWC